MSVFEPAFAFLMKDPGEDPGLTGKVTVDSGGVTKYGISQHAYPALNIRSLTVEDAALLYRTDYFTPLYCFQITDQNVANKLFDLAVNMEAKGRRGWAVKLFQLACCDAGNPITVDEGMGPATLAAINASDPATLLDRVCFHAAEHYRAIAVARPDEAKYLPGWLRRAAKR